MTLRARAVALLLAALAIATLAGIVLYQAYQTVQATQSRTVGDLVPASDELSDVLIGTSDMDSGVDIYAVTGDVASLTPYLLGKARTQQALPQLRDHLTSGAPDLLPLLDRIESNLALWQEGTIDAQIARIAGGDVPAAQEAIRQGLGSRTYGALRSDLSVLNEQLDARVAQGTEDIAGLGRLFAWILAATALGTIALLGAGTLAMSRWVLRPLADLGDQMRGLASEQNTQTPLVASGPPEIRQVAEDAEYLRQSLVSAIDRSVAADEGLAQEGPLVASLQSYLQGPATYEVPGYAIASASLSAEGVVTGDWWTLVTDAPQPHLVIADVSGHGVPAARIAVQMKAFMRLSLVYDENPSGILSRFTEAVSATPDTFVSCVIVALDTTEIRWLNAGHLPPIVIGEPDEPARRLAPTGPVVSAIPGSWQVAAEAVSPGDVIVLYTDGLVEGRDDSGCDVSDDELHQWLRELRAEHSMRTGTELASAIASGLLARARAHATDLRRDDVTVVVVVCC